MNTDTSTTNPMNALPNGVLQSIHTTSMNTDTSTTNPMVSIPNKDVQSTHTLNTKPQTFTNILLTGNVGMDDANRSVVEKLDNGNIKEAVKQMFTDEKTGRALTYAEMRYRYG